MTISTSASSTVFGGNGATTSFGFVWIAGTASNIVVTYTDATGTGTVLTQGTQYTLSLNVAAAGQIWGVGGSVTYPLSGAPLAAGTYLTVQRIVPVSQLTSISNQGDFYPQAVERALDTLCMEIQQVGSTVSRAILFNVADAGPFATLPPVAQRALQLLGFDGNGNPVAAQPSSAIVSSVMQPVVAASSVSAADALLQVVQYMPTVAAIRALSSGSAPTIVYAEGYYAVVDGGEGAFIYAPSDTSSADNGGTIIVDALGRRWHRSYAGAVVTVAQFGAHGDGTTNDTAAFVAAMAWVASLGGGAVIVPKKAYRIDPISVPASVTLQGAVQGPFEGNTNPAVTIFAPTLLPSSTGAPLVSLTGLGASISDILVYYPQQVAPSASAPVVYPATISVPAGNGAANNIRRLTLVNSYIGISISNGRVIVEDCKIGAYGTAIIVDPAEDWVILSNIMIQVFYNTFLGLGWPQPIDTWVMENGIGIQVGRADSIQGTNVNIFGKFTGFVLTDGTQAGISPQYGWGRFTNVDFDTVAFGIIGHSSNAFAGGYQFSNVHITANEIVGTMGQAWLALTAGGSGVPVVAINGGAVDGTWLAGGPGFQIAAGQAFVTNLQGVNPVGDEGPPPVPASGVTLVNPYPFSMNVYVSGGGGVVVALNGTNTNLASGLFRLGIGSNIALAYTSAPIWAWFGD